MSPRFAVDVAESIQGTRVDVGETAHCAGCDARMHEGHPITVVARHRSSGWDIEVVFGPQCAPTDLSEYQSRAGEAVALVEGELGIVMGRHQSWLLLVRPDVLEWIEPAA
jgi:hypothetical protein